MNYLNLIEGRLKKLPKFYGKEFRDIRWGLDDKSVKMLTKDIASEANDLKKYLSQCVPTHEEGCYFGWFYLLGREGIEYYNKSNCGRVQYSEYIIGRDESCVPVYWSVDTGRIIWEDYVIEGHDRVEWESIEVLLSSMTEEAPQ